MIFDFFKKREYSNVVPFPGTTPNITPLEPESPDAIYTIGVTREGTYMTFKMGYTTLTMSKLGCEQLIEQLEVFKNQLKEIA